MHQLWYNTTTLWLYCDLAEKNNVIIVFVNREIWGTFKKFCKSIC